MFGDPYDVINEPDPYDDEDIEISPEEWAEFYKEHPEML